MKRLLIGLLAVSAVVATGQAALARGPYYRPGFALNFYGGGYPAPYYYRPYYYPPPAYVAPPPAYYYPPPVYAPPPVVAPGVSLYFGR